MHQPPLRRLGRPLLNGCASVRLAAGAATVHALYVTPQRTIVIPPTERMTSRGSPMASETYLMRERGRTIGGDDGRDSKNGETEEYPNMKNAPRFAVKDLDRGLFDHGVTPEAKTFIAQAEEEYAASSAYLHAVPGGPGLPEITEEVVDEDTGAIRRRTRVAAPVGDVYVPSNKERFAARGHVGELERQQSRILKPYMMDEQAQLNLKKERQLADLLASPMPAIAKAEEVSQLLLTDFFPQQLSLQRRTAEDTMLLYSQASLQLRLSGHRSAAAYEEANLAKALKGMTPSAALPSPSPVPSLTAHGATQEKRPLLQTLNDIPFLHAMRQLYAHQKAHFTAPTPLMMEHLMVTVSALPAPSTEAFHLANRILLDGEKFVELPTRTTYTSFFTVCQVNNAMPFAVACFKSAVKDLQLQMDAPMLTALLRGLNEGGFVEEAVALLVCARQVPLSVGLLNASMETLLLSKEADSCFSLYDAVRKSGVTPTADTFTLLLLACEKTGQWMRVTAILAEMQQRRVKGNAQTLNLLLKGLLHERLASFAVQLHRTMKEKKVTVWPALEAGMGKLPKLRR